MVISTSIVIFPSEFLLISNLVLKSSYCQYQTVVLLTEKVSIKSFLGMSFLANLPSNRRCSGFNLTMIVLSNFSIGIMSQEAEQIRNKLKEKAKPEKVFFVKRILATPFEVLGVMVPDSREIAKQYNNLDVYEIYNLFDELIKSKIHEERSMAIHILQQYTKKFSLETWKFLRARMQYFQTWDIIDWLATDVFAEILKNNLELTGEIKEMAESKNFWERRLAIESTYRLIKKNKMDLTFF